MSVRAATASDWPAILKLIQEHPDQLMQDHLPEPEEFFVAEESGAVVGCCALEIYSKRMAEIRSLAVTEASRGKGMASALIEACIQRAKNEGVYELLSVTSSPVFFEKFGFDTFNREKYALIRILK